jgi:hypothetical protein
MTCGWICSHLGGESVVDIAPVKRSLSSLGRGAIAEATSPLF